MKALESPIKRSSGSAVRWTEARHLKQPPDLSLSEHVDDPRWALVQRIVASRSLRRSTLLVNFLLFVCDRSLGGRTSEINEKQIGFHVFGRMEGYNASDDNIVRNYARTLRKRLQEFFATEGQHEEIALHIPRGGYLPVFTTRDAVTCAGEIEAGSDIDSIAGANSVSSPDTERTATPNYAPLTDHLDLSRQSYGHVSEEDDFPTTVSIPGTGTSGQNKNWLYAFVILCTIALSALAGYIGAHGLPSEWFRHESSAAKINHIFWSRIFEADRNTYIVPADGGLVMLQSFVRDHVSLEDYADGNYRKDATIERGITGLTGKLDSDDAQRLVRKVAALGNRRYTSIADLELTTQLARLPAVIPGRLMIRYARDVRVDDLRTDNVILIGSIEGNPWVDLFQRQLNFRFSHGAEFGGSGIITNRHPLPGETLTYASEPNDPLLRTYGLLAYVPNLNGTGHALLIEGVNMAGTQAAGEFLLNPLQMQPVLERAMGPNGIIRPFEILIATDNIAANASQPRVLSERVGLQ